MQIRTVLCPLDFSDLSLRALALGTDLCHAFGARLVLHHNLAEAPAGAGMRWMWLQEHQESIHDSVEQRLHELLAAMPAGLEARAVLTRGQAATAILAVQDRVEADLSLLGTHGETTDDHTSVSQMVVEGSTRPVLVLHESADGRLDAVVPPSGVRPWIVVVPTDLSADSLPCVRYALELATAWPVHLHLLHVVSGKPGEEDGGTSARLEENLYLRLRGLLPYDDPGTALCHIRFGDPAVEIVAVAERLGADAIVMGGHARGLLRRFLTRDTSRQVLHRAQCPLWVVPRNWATESARVLDQPFAE